MHCPCCGLHTVPQQAASWTGLETLDLSRNLLRLTTKLTRRDDSTLFTEQHTLKLLGLRRDASEAWTHKDVNAIAKLQRKCHYHGCRPLIHEDLYEDRVLGGSCQGVSAGCEDQLHHRVCEVTSLDNDWTP